MERCHFARIQFCRSSNEAGGGAQSIGLCTERRQRSHRPRVIKRSSFARAPVTPSTATKVALPAAGILAGGFASAGAVAFDVEQIVGDLERFGRSRRHSASIGLQARIGIGLSKKQRRRDRQSASARRSSSPAR